ncbi:hypothetical protein APHNP_1620 [Anaplasma phagocytophilum str. ApNP]|uniref:Uncharacterized protein n=2 Tax=Anaplasma phagocytophilum TaxID=948 RepID=A0A0F3NGF2_ANAPH|nr:hypothetical protein APHMUC_0063 [Anaplasma phagocytophilum str. ApMUC09]KJV66782.1 hypothetical protein APHNP_1620 [Anaplasma phagocytophilum str. ApNP]
MYRAECAFKSSYIKGVFFLRLLCEDDYSVLYSRCMLQ